MLIPVNRCIAVRIGVLSQEMMTRKDERVGATHEVLGGIRVVKLRALGDRMLEKIGKVWARGSSGVMQKAIDGNPCGEGEGMKGESRVWVRVVWGLCVCVW